LPSKASIAPELDLQVLVSAVIEMYAAKAPFVFVAALVGAIVVALLVHKFVG
jgi:hypothetical protein